MTEEITKESIADQLGVRQLEGHELHARESSLGLDAVIEDLSAIAD